jgi:hypothetical protein
LELDGPFRAWDEKREEMAAIFVDLLERAFAAW